MRNMILCISAAIATAASVQYVAANQLESNDVNEVKSQVSMAAQFSIVDHINDVYNSIDFNGTQKIDSAVFQKAYYGYLNLRQEGKLANENILTVCDFSKSSTKYRLWVIDLQHKKVLINDYVAHGQGSGDEFATKFSNTENSHQTSLGFYVTDDTYIGKHGTSLRLHGMDKGYNDAAYDRAVVVHGAAYVSKDFVAGQRKLGRSWGCPAVSNNIADKMINTIKGGSCLFIYYPSKEYLASTHWLNKEINNTGLKGHIASNNPVKRDTVIIYQNGNAPQVVNRF